MITYHPLVTAKDIPNLDSQVKVRIRTAIERKLSVNPILFGGPLTGTLKKLWKLRIGDWRVIYTIEPKETYILIIGHRKEVYKNLLRRL